MVIVIAKMDNMFDWWYGIGVFYKASTVVALLVLFYSCKLILDIVTDPLRDVPGPLLARFTRLWEMHQLRKGRFEQVNIDLHRRYGKQGFTNLQASIRTLHLTDTHLRSDRPTCARPVLYRRCQRCKSDLWTGLQVLQELFLLPFW